MAGLPQPLPVPQPEPAPLRPVPAPERRPSRWKLILPVSLVLVILGLLAWLALRPQFGGGAPPAALKTVQVVHGTFRRTLRVTGQTSARNFANITVPLVRAPDSGRSMILMKLAKPGTYVKAGDVVAQIDAQSLVDHIDDVKDQVAQAANNVKKRLAEQAVDWERLQQTLRVAKANWDKALLDLKAAEVKTELERELYRIRAEEAEANYKQLQADIPLTKQQQAADLRILEIAHKREQIHLERHQDDLKRFTIRTPMSGMVVMQQIFRSGEMAQVQEGDQVSPGQQILKVVDLSSMQLEGAINQAENSLLRVGQPARVGLDAFPGLEFPGTVYAIGALAVRPGRGESYYLRTVPVRIAIHGSDPRLLPDLSAWADVEIEKEDNVLMVPLHAVHTENGQHFVYVKRGDTFEKRPVQLGPRNQTQVVIREGLRAGEQVALERPPEKKPPKP
jgi:RND family efflux transporter MFP subunit